MTGYIKATAPCKDLLHYDTAGWTSHAGWLVGNDYVNFQPDGPWIRESGKSRKVPEIKGKPKMYQFIETPYECVKTTPSKP